MKDRVFSVLFCFLLFSTGASAGQGQAYELGYVSGKLTFTALLLDIFNDICSEQRGMESDGYFQSINDLPREKLGMSFSDIRNKIQKATGKNFEVEATTQIIEMMRDTGAWAGFAEYRSDPITVYPNKTGARRSTCLPCRILALVNEATGHACISRPVTRNLIRGHRALSRGQVVELSLADVRPGIRD